MKKFKIALIGSSCSGKTTLATKLVYELRKRGYLCEGVIGSDRHYTFDPKLLDTSNEAQQYVILQQAFLETEKYLRKDVDILVTDRSLIDFLAYYDYCIGRKKSSIFAAFKHLAYAWLSTYDLIFYLEPLPYRSDRLRPSNRFRREVDKVLKDLIKCSSSIQRIYGDIESRERNILNEVLKYETVFKKRRA